MCDQIVSMAPGHVGYTLFTVVLLVCVHISRVNLWILSLSQCSFIFRWLAGWQLFNAKWKSNANKLLSGFCVIVNHNGANAIVAGVWSVTSFSAGAGVYKSIKQSIRINKIGINWATKSIRRSCVFMPNANIVQMRAPLKWWFSGFCVVNKRIHLQYQSSACSPLYRAGWYRCLCSVSISSD